MRYYFERGYPYLMGIVSIILLKIFRVNYIDSENITAALDCVSTICSLIIGFLGAILPVILGMKNESKFVKYVFENDKNRLFLKYIKETIFAGLITLLISVAMYFSKDIILSVVYNNVFCVWCGAVIIFIFLTYRCLDKMLELIFSSDSKMGIDLYEKTPEEIEEKMMLREHFMKK